MDEITINAKCANCGYEEKQLVYKGIESGENTGIKCPNCDEDKMIMI